MKLLEAVYGANYSATLNSQAERMGISDRVSNEVFEQRLLNTIKTVNSQRDRRIVESILRGCAKAAIAAEWGITQTRVSQIVAKILRRLKHYRYYQYLDKSNNDTFGDEWDNWDDLGEFLFHCPEPIHVEMPNGIHITFHLYKTRWWRALSKIKERPASIQELLALNKKLMPAFSIATISEITGPRGGKYGAVAHVDGSLELVNRLNFPVTTVLAFVEEEGR